MRSIYLSIICFFCFAITVQAQSPVYIHLTSNDELPDIEIYTLVKDLEENIWLGADKGLFKYDGKDYASYTHPDKRGRSLFGLKLDPQGRLWCNNIAGQFFYIEHDTLTLFGDYQEDLKGALFEFQFIGSKMVISTDVSHIITDINTKEKTIIPKPKGAYVDPVVVNNNLYLFNSELDYTIYNKDLKALNKVTSNAFNAFVNKVDFKTKVFAQDTHFFLIVTNQNSYKNTCFSIKENQITPIKLPKIFHDVRIEAIRNYKGKYYIATSKGLYVAHYNDHEFVIVSNYLKTEFITNSTHDNESNLWISTLNNGVFIIPSETLKTYPKIKNNITTLATKNDSICFIGGENGYVGTLNIHTGVTNKIKTGITSKISALDYYPEKDRLIINSVTETQILENNVLRKSVIGPAAKSIHRIDDSRYLCSFYVPTKVIDVLAQTKTIISETRSYKSHYSHKNNATYLCNVNGLLVYDTLFNFQKNILYNGSPIYGFDITETEDGTLWVATYDNGVLGIKDNKVVSQLSTTNGLSSNAPNTVKADKNNLWISTDYGLQYYDIKTKNFKAITQRDGIKSFIIKDINVLGNTIVLASNTGVYTFNKNEIFKDRKIPKPYFTNIAIQGRDTLISSCYTLAQEKSEIRFNFHAKGFKSDEFTKYQYQLAGFDPQWIDVEQGSYHVKFNTLPAGQYTFKLRAKNRFEQQFSAPIAVNLVINLPFYKRWWFIAIVFSILAIMLYAYFNYQKQRLKTRQKIALEKAELNKELVFSQLENLRSQMNPHFIFNALNSIQDYIILNEGKMARAYLVKFSSLIRKYLDHSQKNEVTLAEEVEALTLYLALEKDRFEGNFTYHMYVDPSLDLTHTLIPSLLLQPYVENALKHGLIHKKENKVLTLKFEKNETVNYLICTIEDNGIGRAASLQINKNRYKNHTSFATKASQKRIDLLNQARKTPLKITIKDLYKNNEAAGTRVIIEISLENEVIH